MPGRTQGRSRAEKARRTRFRRFQNTLGPFLNTLKILSGGNNTLKVAVLGAGLKLQWSRGGPTPLSGVRKTQWRGQRGRKPRNCNSVGSNPTEFQLHHLRPQWP